MYVFRTTLVLLLALAISTVSENSVAQLPPTGLNKGVNFGNMLEAPFEGAWGLTMQSIFFDKVVEGGFDHIRLPVSWTHHASTTAPYTINPVFFERVDWALAQAERRGIKVILNMHHYDEFNSNPLAERARALGFWKQISHRYRRRGSFLYFEILNEPHAVFNDQPELWNQFMNDALNVIRKFNPTRPVLVGPVRWNSIQALLTTNFRPPNDDNLIITVHNYEPFEFTHQGATWVSPVPPLGVTWTGNRFKISSPWQNWSWSTSVANTNNGIQVTYNSGWAGLYFHSDQGVGLATKLTLAVDQARQLRIVMRNAITERVYFLNTGANGGTYNINLDPTMGAITDIFVQNNTIAATQPFLLSKFDIEAAGQTQSVIATELSEVNRLMDSAADWAQARARPLYLGEFGAYELADLASRAAWTTAVRVRAEARGIGWGYWELAAGFGVYNPNNSTWRRPLLNALIPQ